MFSSWFGPQGADAQAPLSMPSRNGLSMPRKSKGPKSSSTANEGFVALEKWAGSDEANPGGWGGASAALGLAPAKEG